nr:GFA family protein [Glycomyces harbinensis]
MRVDQLPVRRRARSGGPVPLRPLPAAHRRRVLGERPGAARGIADRGGPRSYRTVGSENGNLRDRQFCGDCGTPIFTVLHERPDVVIVKAGTLDDTSGLRPAAEVWWRRAQDWLEPDAARPRFEGDAA